MNLFLQVELGFDWLFSYNRQQTESFNHRNVMKNNSISEQLKLQEQNFQPSERKKEINQDDNRENFLSSNLENKKANHQTFNTNTYITTKQENNTSANPSFNQNNNQTSASSISFISSEIGFPIDDERQKLKPKRKKKKRRL